LSRRLLTDGPRRDGHRRFSMVTGKDQLDVKDLVAKLGSMADSSQCCATGTCDSVYQTDFKAPTIPTERDTRDAVKLAAAAGYLRA
jgi:hypothetical protein